MNEYDENTWIGTWEDGTGYWIEISKQDEELKIERSGIKSPIEVLSLTHNYKILRYKEKGSIAYQHTLTLKDERTASDEWKIISTGEIWMTEELKKN